MPLSFPGPQAPLHVYRHLLREASYLPPVCTAYVKDRIRTRFRRHRRESDPAAARLRLGKARHDLRFLRAANAGDMARMRRLLLKCFGRTGPRRRELVNRLVAPAPPADSAELAEMVARMKDKAVEASDSSDEAAESGVPLKGRKGGKPDFLDKWDTSKVLALAKSQSVASITNSPRPNIKSGRMDADADIPKSNIWGRPLPLKVHRTKEKKWWKAMIHRVLPPVEKGEWNLLGALARGETSAKASWEMPSRRPAARSVTHKSDTRPGQDAEAAVWDWGIYVNEPVRSLERKSSRKFKLLTGEEQASSSPYAAGPPVGIHTFSPRFWRRMYANIWQMTPIMEKRPGADGKFQITWGKLKAELPYATNGYGEFFEGVDSKGRVSRQQRVE
ncbi:hypothetical protein NKR23_g9079 [Pleurostoma richardsiae]|uniref:LYR motif-containing protein Cup1-like N-terminal domain-containing protein n=1 Tax=Pleurostoma richardsiae TaxID=41990 RepID=A0AA38RNY9_9PEZI|nr:hypothetical protein NKR23_g9079 [Pleurostoma richardsiae]